MLNLSASIKPECNTGFKSKPVEQNEWKNKPVKCKIIKKRIKEQVNHIFSVLEKKDDNRSFDAVEKAIVPLVFTLGSYSAPENYPIPAQLK